MSIKFFRIAAKLILVLLNILLALLLIFACYGGFLTIDKFALVGLLNLGSFYLLIANLCFFIFWLFVKRWISLISLGTILLCWSPLQNIFQFRFNVSFDEKKNRNTIRVMSWNVEHFDIIEHKTHPEVKTNMISLINQYSPDVACFQEMVASDSFSKAINYLPDFKRKLKMSGYHYSYIKYLDFDNEHHFGIIIFSKFPIIKKETIIITPNSYNATYQYVDIVRNNDTFRIFNIHLQTLRFSQQNRYYLNYPSIKNEEDITESKSIIQKFEKGYLKHHIQSDSIKSDINKSPYPVIVCGDFNDVPNSYAYNAIGKGFKNAFREKGSGVGNTFEGISPTLRIDNIFCDNRFSVEQFIRIKKKLSDHFPIIADLIFHKQ